MNISATLSIYMSSSTNKILANWQNSRHRRFFYGLFYNVISQVLLAKDTPKLSSIALGLNAPIRILNIIEACKENNILNLSFQVSALAALFFPSGLIGAIAIDCISGGKNLYDSYYPPEVTERALVLSNQNESQAQKRFPEFLEKVFLHWPNANSEKNYLGISTNLVCASMIANASETSSSIGTFLNPPIATFLNAPIRLFNILDEIKERHLLRSILQISAFTALFFPYGSIISIGIDCILEGENLYRFIPEWPKSSDEHPLVNQVVSYNGIPHRVLKVENGRYYLLPTANEGPIPDVVFHKKIETKEDAMDMLSLSDINDIDKKELKFDNMSKYEHAVVFLKKRQSKATPYFARQIQVSIDNLDNAYKFLKSLPKS